jgi:Mor family transcriptional regulator
MPDMSGQALVAELLAAAASPEPLAGVQGVLSGWGGRVVYLPAPRRAQAERRRDVAVLLLRAGLDLAEAVPVLAQRVGISERHARRLLRLGHDSTTQCPNGVLRFAQPDTEPAP